MNTATDETALLIPDQNIVAEAFKSDEKIVEIVAAIEKECRAVHLSVATAADRKAIASLAYKVSRSKTAADSIGKGLTEDAQKLINSINARRNTVKTRLDALRDEIRKPLDDWEAADDLRKDRIKTRIADAFGLRALPAPLAELRALQDATALIELDDTWGEFLDEAARAKDSFMRHLTGKIGEAERQAAQEEELARLRAEAERRQREDAERAERERIAAAEQAESAAKIAALQAQLEAMQQQPLPEPVGIQGANPSMAILDELPSPERFNPLGIGRPAPMRTPAVAPVAEFVAVKVAEVALPFPGDPLEAEITAAVLALIENLETHEEAAARIATAIVMGEIPYVEVKE